jgi:hypothetical protein
MDSGEPPQNMQLKELAQKIWKEELVNEQRGDWPK